MREPKRASDGGLEEAVGRVLGLGIGATTVCLISGLALMLTNAGGRFATALLTSGMVILMATPAARVVVSIVDYARERDWMFFVLTLVVLLELAASVLVAMYGG